MSRNSIIAFSAIAVLGSTFLAPVDAFAGPGMASRFGMAHANFGSHLSMAHANFARHMTSVSFGDGGRHNGRPDRDRDHRFDFDRFRDHFRDHFFQYDPHHQFGPGGGFQMGASGGGAFQPPYGTSGWNGGGSASNTATGAPRSSGLAAIALSWTAKGEWVAQKSADLDTAGATAMNQCNSQYGQCTLSTAAVQPTQFACLVVARANEDQSKLFASTGASADAANAAVTNQLNNAGLTGQTEYSGCNG